MSKIYFYNQRKMAMEIKGTPCTNAGDQGSRLYSDGWVSMKISFKNNSCGLTISTLMWASKSTIVYVRCSLAIKKKKSAFKPALWGSEMRIWASRFKLLSVCRLFRTSACVYRKFNSLSIVLSLHLLSYLLSFCCFVTLSRSHTLSGLARKKTSDTDIISRKINCIRCCGFHFIRLRSKIPTPSRFRTSKQ